MIFNKKSIKKPFFIEKMGISGHFSVPSHIFFDFHMLNCGHGPQGRVHGKQHSFYWQCKRKLFF